jgi:hypothetical protein
MPKLNTTVRFKPSDLLIGAAVLSGCCIIGGGLYLLNQAIAETMQKYNISDPFQGFYKLIEGLGGQGSVEPSVPHMLSVYGKHYAGIASGYLNQAGDALSQVPSVMQGLEAKVFDGILASPQMSQMYTGAAKAAHTLEQYVRI